MAEHSPEHFIAAATRAAATGDLPSMSVLNTSARLSEIKDVSDPALIQFVQYCMFNQQKAILSLINERSVLHGGGRVSDFVTLATAYMYVFVLKKKGVTRTLQVQCLMACHMWHQALCTRTPHITPGIHMS